MIEQEQILAALSVDQPRGRGELVKATGLSFQSLDRYLALLEESGQARWEQGRGWYRIARTVAG